MHSMGNLQPAEIVLFGDLIRVDFSGGVYIKVRNLTHRFRSMNVKLCPVTMQGFCDRNDVP